MTEFDAGRFHSVSLALLSFITKMFLSDHISKIYRFILTFARRSTLFLLFGYLFIFNLLTVHFAEGIVEVDFFGLMFCSFLFLPINSFVVLNLTPLLFRVFTLLRLLNLLWLLGLHSDSLLLFFVISWLLQFNEHLLRTLFLGTRCDYDRSILICWFG